MMLRWDRDPAIDLEGYAFRREGESGDARL